MLIAIRNGPQSERVLESPGQIFGTFLGDFFEDFSGGYFGDFYGAFLKPFFDLFWKLFRVFFLDVLYRFNAPLLRTKFIGTKPLVKAFLECLECSRGAFTIGSIERRRSR